MVFANAAMASRTNLEREMFSWIDKEGVIPPGNGPEKDLWEVRVLHAGHLLLIGFLSVQSTVQAFPHEIAIQHITVTTNNTSWLMMNSSACRTANRLISCCCMTA